MQTFTVGVILLALYLIAVGMIGLFGLSLGSAAIIVPILALVSGIFLLIGR